MPTRRIGPPMVAALAILIPGLSAAQQETSTVDAPRFWLGGDVMGSWGLGGSR